MSKSFFFEAAEGKKKEKKWEEKKSNFFNRLLPPPPGPALRTAGDHPPLPTRVPPVGALLSEQNW